jgi:simple sugar transport system ATP-binding protein
MTVPPAVRLSGIVKRFPGVLACDEAGLEVRAGEVHALLGENGAGKSTLMHVLAGLYQPEAGEVQIGGRTVRLRCPRDAIGHGVGMVHQHFMLVPTLTVAENLALGAARTPFVLRRGALEADVARLSREAGLPVDPGARVWQLSVGEQQRVEILKVLQRGARVIVLDEPSAVLAPPEVVELFAALRRLVAEGRSVILITHKLGEVAAVADRATILRRGRVVAAGLPVGDTPAEELSRHMIGRSVEPRPPRPSSPPGAPVLEVRGLGADGDRGTPALRGVDFDVRGGEIYGVAGVSGNGQRELIEVLAGLRPSSGGRVRLDGVDRTGADAAALRRAGVAHIPDDRLAVGVAPHLSVAENLALTAGRALRGWLTRARLNDEAARRSASAGLDVPDLGLAVGTLSGGNLQRVILARELASRPRLILAAQPTRGLDVGATEAVHRLLQEQRAAGAAVLVVSEDLDELLALADRVGVLYEGRLAGEQSAPDLDAAGLGRWMTGAA